MVLSTLIVFPTQQEGKVVDSCRHRASPLTSCSSADFRYGCCCCAKFVRVPPTRQTAEGRVKWHKVYDNEKEKGDVIRHFLRQ